MSHAPSAPHTSRRPFSLREMFCLTTLAAMALALTLHREWTLDERWLLGLTLGCALLGIAIARVCKRRAAWPGMLAGTLGGIFAMAIIARSWLSELFRVEAEGIDTEALAKYRIEYLSAGAVTAGLAILLTLLTVLSFRLLVWVTTSGETGMLPSVRRHPVRATLVAASACAILLLVANVDFVLNPRAWRPRSTISLPKLQNPIAGKLWMIKFRRGSLSRHGDWLEIQTTSYGSIVPASSDIYCLTPRPHLVRMGTPTPQQPAFLTFDCDHDRLAYLDYGPGRQRHALRLYDLRTKADTLVANDLDHDDIHSLQWLPGSRLVVYHGDDWNGRKGYSLLRWQQGAWSRQTSEEKVVFDGRSDTSLVYTEAGLRIIGPNLEEAETLSQEWLESMTEGLGFDKSAWLKISPDGRFILAGTKIYDRESRKVLDEAVPGRWLQWHFVDLTPRGYAITIDRSRRLAFPFWADFLTEVPFGRRLHDWLMRDCIRLIDPLTGMEVARTQPVRDFPSTISLSHDGSRMAVFHDRGVNIYDVPAAFR